MPALAITDTGNLFGALEFSEALSGKRHPADHRLHAQGRFRRCVRRIARLRPRHGQRKLPSLVLLAKDETGYRNLMRLSSRAYLDTPDTAEPHVAMGLAARARRPG